MLEIALQKQESYLNALRQSGGSGLGSRMDKLLLAVNTRSGRSDHLINIAKLVSDCFLLLCLHSFFNCQHGRLLGYLDLHVLKILNIGESTNIHNMVNCQLVIF